MPNQFENYTTEALLDYCYGGDGAAHQNAMDELKARVIEENDDDDSPQHRGGIRPYHAPLVP